jgi:hypothetical protein
MPPTVDTGPIGFCISMTTTGGTRPGSAALHEGQDAMRLRLLVGKGRPSRI